MSEGETLINAIIGAVVGTVVGMFAFPLGPLAGGMVGGYLHGGDRRAGVRVGVVVGLLTTLPLLMVMFAFWVALSALGIGVGTGMVGGPWAMVAGGFGAFVVLWLVFAIGYIVGTAALGGWLGNYLDQDTGVDV